MKNTASVTLRAIRNAVIGDDGKALFHRCRTLSGVRISSSSFGSSSVCVSRVSYGSALNSSVNTSDFSLAEGKLVVLARPVSRNFVMLSKLFSFTLSASIDEAETCERFLYGRHHHHQYPNIHTHTSACCGDTMQRIRWFQS